MQMMSVISLVGASLCALLFLSQRRWVLAAAFFSSACYVLFSRVTHLAFLPDAAVDAFAVIFFVLVVVEVVTRIRARSAAAQR